MRPQILLGLITIFCCIIFTRCGIVESDDDYFKGTMQAKVDGELIIFDDAYGKRVLGDDMNWSGITMIVGITDKNFSGYEIQIDIPSIHVKGKIYNPPCMFRKWEGNYYDYNLTAYFTKETNPPSSESSSTFTFTSITNSTCEGTFSFTAHIVDENLKDSLLVTGGKFEIDSDGRKW